MNLLRAIATCVCLAAACDATGGEALSNRVDRMICAGQFSEAVSFLSSQASAGSASSYSRADLDFETDRLRRIRKDYSLGENALFKRLKARVRGLSRLEYKQWVEEGRFDSLVIDGERFFMPSSVANLFFRYPVLDSRRVPALDTAKLDHALLATCDRVSRLAAKAGTDFVTPKHFHARMTISLSRSFQAHPDDVISAWLPIPRHCPSQCSFKLLSSSSTPVRLAMADSPIRSVYLEQPVGMRSNPQLWIEYEYSTYGVRFSVEAGRVQPCETNDPQLHPFLIEGPHVVFTQAARDLSSQITGTETNPCIKARRFYDWISENIRYSFSPEYSTIRNLGDACLRNRYGDCGQEAFLFITFCRLHQIPARWQSGWKTMPGDQDIHDWAEIYLAPYGWIPVDPYEGVYAMQYAASLKPAEKLRLRDFFFGGLDPYRMLANSDHCQPLSPLKSSLRSDPVDFQRAELQCHGTNVYFDNFTYTLKVSERTQTGNPE
jgi:hypothetical protein